MIKFKKYNTHWLLLILLKLPKTANGVASREEEEISELQEDDRDQFCDQLASVGMLGRIAAEHCIPLLTRYRNQSRVQVNKAITYEKLNFANTV